MKLHNNLLALLLLYFLFLNGCGSSNFANITELENQYQNSEKLIPENYPEDDAVIVYRKQKVDVSVHSGSLYYEITTEESLHSVTKLFRNIEDYASYKIYLHEGDHLKEISARTVKEDGTEVVLESKDFYHTTGSSGGSTVFTDERAVTFTFPQVAKNCIIEFNYTVTKNNPFVHDEWMMQSYLPIKKNIFELMAPRILVIDEVKGGFGWTWRYKPYNFIDMPDVVQKNLINPSGSTLDAKFVNSWVLEDVPAFEPEPQMPDHDLYKGYMKFTKGEFKSWDDVADWYWSNYYIGMNVVSDEIRKKATELTTGLKSEEEKIQALYNFAQGIRYVSLYLGNGGLRPHEPKTVISNSWGDCKDKATLLLVLLKAIDIESFPVLALTRDDGRIDPSFPSYSFNHMILKVKAPSGKIYWLDPTLQFAPLNEIPSSLEGMNVLVVYSEKSGKIERIPSSVAQDNLVKIDQIVSLVGGDSTQFNVAITFKGDENYEYRSFFKDKTPKEIDDYIKSMVIGDMGNIRVKSWSHSNLDSINVPFRFNFTFSTSGAAVRQGDLLLLYADPLQLMSKLNWLKKDTRKYPIEFSQPYRIEKTTQILPLTNFSTRNLPEPISLENQNFSFKKSFQSGPKNEILVSEVYEVKSQWVLPGHYAATKQFFDKVKAKLNERVIFTRN
ncbi:MAG: DUF3857 and transglutaminase domain-containing protein [Bacteroidetes bacterium]|nr:DUF3857 and transglutaminase domain-containing protein [Bacteroidota bacterium]